MSSFHETEWNKIAFFHMQMSVTSACTFWNNGTTQNPTFLKLSKFWLSRRTLKRETNSISLRGKKRNRFKLELKSSVEKVLMLKYSSLLKLGTLSKPPSSATSCSYGRTGVDNHVALCNAFVLHVITWLWGFVW